MTHQIKWIALRSISHRAKGFSLVELMATVAIISILAASAVSSYRTMIVRARQVEAKSNLSIIYSLQQAYHNDKGVYFGGPVSVEAWPLPANCNNGNALGFSLRGCAKARYWYLASSVGTDIGTATELYLGTGTGNRSIYVGCTVAAYDGFVMTFERVIGPTTTSMTAAAGCL